MGGRVVQLQQGERLALESDDVDKWIRAFEAFPIVQLIDLDAAMGRPANDALVRHVASRLPCQVGGSSGWKWSQTSKLMKSHWLNGYGCPTRNG